MLLTEEEAKAMQCPMTFAAEGGPWPCIASHCAAWRWAASDELVIPEGQPIPDQYEPCGRIRSTSRGVETWWQACRLQLFDADGNKLLPLRGYCGMAGRPE